MEAEVQNRSVECYEVTQYTSRAVGRIARAMQPTARLATPPAGLSSLKPRMGC